MDKQAYVPDGTMFICAACGKTSNDRYARPGSIHTVLWDESCSMNAILVKVPEGFTVGDRATDDQQFEVADIRPEEVAKLGESQ